MKVEKILAEPLEIHKVFSDKKEQHDFLCEMMEEYNKYNFILENGTLNMLPSPYYQTAVLERNGLKLNGEYQIIKGNAIYPEKMLCAKSIYTFVINTKPYTHAIHHFDGSWSDSSNKLYNMSTEKEFTGHSAHECCDRVMHVPV